MRKKSVTSSFHLWFCALAALGLVCLSGALALADEKPSLFSPTDRNAAEFVGLEPVPAAAGSEAVLALNMDVVTGGARAVTFGVPLSNEIIELERRMLYPDCNNVVTWIGRAVGADGSMVLASKDGYTYGHVEIGAAIYEIEPVGDTGLVRIYQLDPGVVTTCDCPDDAVPLTDEELARELYAGRNFEEASANSARYAGRVIVDVLILHTPGFASKYGSGMEAKIAELIGVANTSYVNSKVLMFLRQVDTMQLSVSDDCSSSGFSTHLNGIYNDTGAYNGVHARRNAVGADLVAMLQVFQAPGDYCGLAKLWNNFGTFGDSTAFSVTAVGQYEVSPGSWRMCTEQTMAHEMGHNEGLMHNWPKNCKENNSGIFSYSYGHRFPQPEPASTIYRTVMSYQYNYLNSGDDQCYTTGTETRVSVFSSPNVQYGGYTTGTAANNDSARSLNTVRDKVHRWRSTRITTHHDAMVADHSDYTGSGDSNRAVWRPSNGRWYRDGGTLLLRLGQFGDAPVPGDYNNDGTTDLAVWRPTNGRWYINSIGNFKLGQMGDIPVPADYTGTAATDRAVWRPSNGRWYVAGMSPFKLGKEGDVPVPGDYDGDGKAERAVWRPSNGRWYVEGLATVRLGQSGDVPVPANYTGSVATERAVWRPGNGKWYVQGLAPFKLGQQGDVPVPGDWAGSALVERAVWRRSNGRWYFQGGTSAKLGRSNDVPLVRGR